MNREKRIENVTVWGAAINLALTALKAFAGIFGKSSAMLSDAVHSLSDLASDIIVLVMVRIASKSTDRNHDYGHGKFETLAALAVSLLLLIAGAELLSGGIRKILTVLHGGELPVPGSVALWAALISIAVKEVLFQWTVRVGRETGSQAAIANAWHHRSDALSSIGSALGIGGAMLFGGKWTVLDPAACCIISIIIIVTAVKMAIPAIGELTEASLPDDIEDEITDTIESIGGVQNAHALKTRHIGKGINIDSHIVVNPQMTVAEAHAITEKVEKALRERFGDDTQISIHVEPDVNSD